MRIANRTQIMLGVAVVVSLAANAMTAPQQPGNQAAALDALRGLAGTWVAVAPPQEGQKPQTLIFKSTSGDSAVVETMFPGSKHEMINLYHADGDAIVMTHYCMLGNQPHMKLASSEHGVLKFEFAGAGNLKSRQEAHMDSLELTIKGDRLTEKWGFYKDGKLEKYETFEFKRQG